MNYDEFKQYVSIHLREWFPDDLYDISIRKVVKNNGLILDGLCIFQKEKKTSPTLYLEPYYQKYQGGSIMADIFRMIERDYQLSLKESPFLDRAESSYEAVKSQIIMRLVNYDKNKEILEECPYIRFYDLAITFRWLAYQDEIGISSALISNREMEKWNITKEQLYEDAVKNTPRIFPGKIQKLKDMIEDCGLSSDQGLFELYVLTNEQGVNGATCILYDHFLEDFAKEVKSSYYLLPSSIHEMMICLKDDTITETMLLSLVKDANRMVVTMGEVLSDSIYYYNRQTGQLSAISNVLS